MQSIDNHIKNKIGQNKRGKIFFGDDFAKFGTAEAVRLALFRAVKSGLLIRVAHGIYCFPKKNETGEYQLPTITEIAHAIAKRDKIRIVPTGAYALHALGIDTQVPANVVFKTDGAPRRIAVGKGRGILFKHTSEARSLAYKSQLLMLIASALREIGEGNATPQELARIKSLMSNVSEKEFNHDIKLMPQWVRKILLSL
jgi:hypothetical protein